MPRETSDLPTILRDLPFYEDQRTLSIPDGPAITIRHHQIILWVSITPPGLVELPSSARRLPAVLDTGFNDTFLMQEQHFRAWAGQSPHAFDVLESLSVHTHRVPLLDADVWLHCNRAGHRDEFASRLPFRLELSTGIAVSPAVVGAPRLPLLGLLALRRANLHLYLDCERCRVSLRTPRRFWFIG